MQVKTWFNNTIYNLLSMALIKHMNNYTNGNEVEIWDVWLFLILN